MTTLIKHQTKKHGPKEFKCGKQLFKITATVRHDDQCGNGHNSFSITGEILRLENGMWRFDSGGCLHQDIAKHFPELAPYIKWHLCSTDGPLHYIASTTYHASDRDHWGLRKGEKRQIRNCKTGKLAWKLEASEKLEEYIDADECPPQTATLRYVPWCNEGEGKEPNLEAARSCAIWPDATLEQLQDKKALEERLPALLKEFESAVRSLGLEY